jgi:hypothetical protein
MKINFKEIATAWFNVLAHTPLQKKLADDRLDICLECPSKKEILKDNKWFLKCGECGCQLKAKVYTNYTYKDKEGSCPLEKWKEVEDEFLKYTKSKKTII